MTNTESVVEGTVATTEVVPTVETAVIVNPRDYGLDEKRGSEIAIVFTPVVVEKNMLTFLYNNIISQEISKAVVVEAHDLRMKMTKVRTNTAKIHKAEKDFYLCGGRFVDAWKNKTTVSLEQMESRLLEIENYYENIEKEKIEKLKEQRIAQLSGLCDNPNLYQPERMDSDTFNQLVEGLEALRDQKIEKAKQELAEQETARKEKQLYDDRKDSLLPFWNFTTSEIRETKFGAITDHEFNEIQDFLLNAKLEYEKEKESIRMENERLDAYAKEQQRLFEKELKEKQDKIDSQKKESDALAKQIKDKADAEAKEHIRVRNLQVAEAKAPDKEKLSKLINSLSIENIELRQDKSKEVLADIKLRLSSFITWAQIQIDHI